MGAALFSPQPGNPAAAQTNYAPAAERFVSGAGAGPCAVHHVCDRKPAGADLQFLHAQIRRRSLRRNDDDSDNADAVFDAARAGTCPGRAADHQL